MLTAGQRRVARFSAPPPLPGLEPPSHQEELFGDEVVFSQSNAALAGPAWPRDRPPAGRLAGRGPPAGRRLPGLGGVCQNRAKRLVADAWCAAFVWIKREDAPPAIVNRVFTDLKKKGDSVRSPSPTATEIERLAEKDYSFFHWHLEFPDIFCACRTAGEADIRPRHRMDRGIHGAYWGTRHGTK